MPHFLFALLALLCAVLTTSAQAGGFVINIGPGNKDFPLALPKPMVGDPSAATPSDTVWNVVRHDLEMTGYFDIINPDAYIEQGKGVEPGTFDFADWKLIKASGLAKTRVASAGGLVQADVYVYDVNGGTKLSARRFSGPPAEVRSLGHRIADEILLALTGQKGFFGSRLAVVGNRGGNKEIYLMDIDGYGPAQVTRNGSINLSPEWSPDGGQIAWTSFKQDNPDLYVKDLASGRTRVLSNQSGINTGASWSPDGSRIALTRSHEGDSDIYVLDARTGAVLSRITEGGGIDVACDWSPDGSQLAFASERSGGSQIFVQKVGGGAATRVSRQGTFNNDPVFAPDGSRIAFVGRDKNFDVFVQDLASGRVIRITEGMGDNEDPSWSPDGRYLVFSSTRNGRSEIWLSTADGRHQTAVTENSGGWTQPVWAPGRK